MDAIIYTTNTGSTGQYAKLLAQETGLPAYSLAEAKKRVFAGAEVVYLGWIMAGSVKGCAGAAKRYQVCAVCGVGMGAPTPELVPGFRAKMGIPQSTAVFYLQGGFDINRLKGPMKLIMKAKCKEIAGRLSVRAELNPAEQATLAMTKGAVSCVSRENLAEVIAWYK